MSITEVLIESLHMDDRMRPRSQQVSIGPSSLGGCSRRVFHELQEAPTSNPETLRLAAVMGTAIHGAIEAAFRRLDPWHERYMLEVEVEHNGMQGHLDLYDKAEKRVVDWKTKTLKGLNYLGAKSEWWQVQVYGYLMVSNGFPVETVTLVGIARDGQESDIVEMDRPYDEAAALEALAWLEDVKSLTEVPNPERSAKYFCSKYCGYYSPDASFKDKTACPGQ